MFTATRAVPLGFQNIADLSSAVGLTVPVGSTFALITVSGQAVRFRDDGTDPTDSVGVVMPVDARPLEYSGNLNAIKFIETAASATLDVLYYRNAG